MDTTAAKSQAQSMRSSIVSFQMTPDCTALLHLVPTTLERRTGNAYQGAHQQERNGLWWLSWRKFIEREEPWELQEKGTPRSIELVVPIASSRELA